MQQASGSLMKINVIRQACFAADEQSNRLGVVSGEIRTICSSLYRLFFIAPSLVESHLFKFLMVQKSGAGHLDRRSGGASKFPSSKNFSPFCECIGMRENACRSSID